MSAAPVANRPGHVSRPYPGPLPPSRGQQVRAGVLHAILTAAIALGALGLGSLLGYAIWLTTRNM